MRMSQGGWWLGVVAAVCFGACETDEADGQDPGVRDFDENGFRLNGFRLNGFRLNGFRLDGFALTGGDGDAIQLEEIRLAKGSKGKGSQVTSAWLAGSELRVETDAGKQLSGPQLKGAELVFTVREGETTAQKTVRIVKVKPLANGGDVWLYDLKIRQGTGAWYPLCIDHRGTPTEAILLRGVWDPVTGDRITPEPGQATTFACRDAALGKCVEWGYPPWASVDGVSLADHHQTCTRASRADYCGDGVSHTHDGVRIHVLDELGIQAGADDSYVVEAEWDPDGAVCLDEENTRLPDPVLACDPPPCGEPFASGGLIQTGLPADP